MNIVSGCQGRQCQVQQGLPFVGPALALGMMLIVALAAPVAMMFG